MAREFGFVPVTTQPYYFISYNSQDAVRVSAICRELDRRGIPMWYDRGLFSGEKWEKQIINKIENCHEVIIFITKRLMTRENPFVYKEFIFARRMHKKIHIIMLDEISFEDVSVDLKSWFVDLESLQGVYPPQNSAPVQVADAMERLIEFVRKPEPVSTDQPNEKSSVEKANGKSRGEPSLKKLVISVSAAVLLIAAAGTGAWMFFGRNKEKPEISVETAAVDDTSGYLFEYDETTDSYIVTGISDESFMELSIPEKFDDKPVTGIGEKAFYDRPDLERVTIPSSVKSIGDNAFGFCIDLTEIILPESLESIGEDSFYNCKGLKRITLPSSLISIDACAFQGCTGLTQITIPVSVEKLQKTAFLGCSNLSDIDVAHDNKTYSSKDGIVYSKDLTELILYPEGKSGVFNVPTSVKTIGSYVFLNSENLSKVYIPSSVTTVYGSSFLNCSYLTGIFVDPGNNYYTYEDGVLYNKDKTELIRVPGGKRGDFTVPDSVRSIGDNAFSWCQYLTGVTISSSVESIEDDAFRSCTNLKTIVIPNSVKSLGEYAFYDCNSLTEIDLPTSVVSIGDRAFSDCKALEQINIPSSVVSIGDSAFCKCEALTEIILPSSVEDLGESAFSDCTSLTRVNIPPKVEKLGWFVFWGCKSLTEIEADRKNPKFASEDGVLYNKEMTEIVRYPQAKEGEYQIPSTVTNIGIFAFYECTGLTEIDIPSSVTSIDSSAFNLCANLREISVPSSVTDMGYSAFRECPNLSRVTFLASKTSIPNYTFAYDTGLTEITIPSTVTSIDKCAFLDCKKLNYVNIPASVTSIDETAFAGCDNLTIYGESGSYAEQFAKENRIDFVTE